MLQMHYCIVWLGIYPEVAAFKLSNLIRARKHSVLHWVGKARASANSTLPELNFWGHSEWDGLRKMGSSPTELVNTYRSGVRVYHKQTNEAQSGPSACQLSRFWHVPIGKCPQHLDTGEISNSLFRWRNGLWKVWAFVQSNQYHTIPLV